MLGLGVSRHFITASLTELVLCGVVLVPYPRNDSFVGRAAVLHELKQQLLKSGSQARVALYEQANRDSYSSVDKEGLRRCARRRGIVAASRQARGWNKPCVCARVQNKGKSGEPFWLEPRQHFPVITLAKCVARIMATHPWCCQSRKRLQKKKL